MSDKDIESGGSEPQEPTFRSVVTAIQNAISEKKHEAKPEMFSAPESDPLEEKAAQETSLMTVDVDPQTNGRFYFVSVILSDGLVFLFNIFMLVFQPRLFNQHVYRNSARDFAIDRQGIAKWQFSKVFFSNWLRFKTHPLQRFHSLLRRCNVSDTLKAQMSSVGNSAFYSVVCGQDSESRGAPSFKADFTKLDDLSTVSSAADYLLGDMRIKYKDEGNCEDRAKMARYCFARGFSRPITAGDRTDWADFREELRGDKHLGDEIADEDDTDVVNIAVSYKGKESRISRRMDFLKGDSGKERSREKFEEVVQLSFDFIDDFRWGQLKLACIQVAHEHKKSKVRVWIDRLVKYNIEDKLRKQVEKLAKWEDFGLFPYAVCPVVRLYDPSEKEFGTDFWRRLELVLGIAGKGVYAEDFMLRQYDETVFYTKGIHQQLNAGFARLGGHGVYLRAVTLAMATAVLTDGVSVAQKNESSMSKKSAVGWKAWAIRTITEGAYSKDHVSMMTAQKKAEINSVTFRTVAFWESFISQSPELHGASYLDMSTQHEKITHFSTRWDGVTEWLGMIPEACEISGADRQKIMNILTDCCTMFTLTSTTGHVASMLTLEDTNDLGSRRIKLKRSLVVNLSRFSTSTEGEVTSVKEATGLWGGLLLPWWLFYFPSPLTDQVVKRDSDGRTAITYRPMVVSTFIPVSIHAILTWHIAISYSIILISLNAGTKLVPSWVLPVTIPVVITYITWVIVRPWWPWSDVSDQGEGLFDNLVKQSLYLAGIKWRYYRQISPVKFNEIMWD